MTNNKNQNKSVRLINVIDGYIIKLERFLLLISIISLVVMFLSMFWGVFSREILNISLLWTNELAGYAMVYLVFLSIPWLFKEKGHVVVDIITSKLDKKRLRIHSMVICVVSIVIFGLFFKGSFDITLNYYLKDITMLGFVKWPKYILYLPIAIGSFIVVVRLLVELLRTILLKSTIFTNQDSP